MSRDLHGSSGCVNEAWPVEYAPEEQRIFYYSPRQGRIIHLWIKKDSGLKYLESMPAKIAGGEYLNYN